METNGTSLAIVPEVGQPAKLVGSEIVACNGIVHIIDAVRPTSLCCNGKSRLDARMSAEAESSSTS